MASSHISEYGASARSPVPHYFSVPRLPEDDMYHAFISFSSADSTWVHQLIDKLEDTFPSIKICTHDRDFTAGKTIIENMTESIQKSQRILIVLSPDFVDSRWCLFEANLSMFQDCMSHKAVVPVMLKPCPMPLYLSHLTYLEVEDECFFEKLCNRLLKNNAKETDDVLVHFQSSILYGGKQLLSLAAVNENDNDLCNGQFSDTCVPDSLKAVIKDPEIYKAAIRLINKTPTRVLSDVLSVKWKACGVLLGLVMAMTLSLALLVPATDFETRWCFIHIPGSLIPLIVVAIKLIYWKKYEDEKITQIMSRATGEANVLLAETSVLAGCASKANLVFVFAPLKKCKQMFRLSFASDNELANRMWEKAMSHYSSDYANCLAKKYFPGCDPEPPGHFADGICFCQYVDMQIKQGDCP